ncbi:MAG: tRNA 2-thiouridine(34) synthase MnmA [Bdellovibrionota bacterium]|nr:tRNA 2-thiouridine(34) synthase MnmA [Bdellovibrionota bacterium]
MSKGRVLLAMSGGVDSSAAAAVLKEQGYDVVGVTMQVWDYNKSCDLTMEGNGSCCSSIDVEDARSVADTLDIPFYVMNCEAKFKASVIDPFIQNYLDGKTPLPCVDCNTFLKFDHLLKKMNELGCDYLATGHYARIDKDHYGNPVVVTSADTFKDQTYFLFTLPPEILPKLLFPVGGMEKPKVREYAERAGLSVARKKDSVGICFVGKGKYAEFMEEHGNFDPKTKRGVFKQYPDGKVLGKHRGIHHYTYGQRRGLGLSHHEPLFVIKTDVTDNTVWVGPEKYLFSQRLEMNNTHWHTQLEEGEIVDVKIRYAHSGAKARVYKNEDGTAKIEFLESQRAITPGQAAVVYRDNSLVGGGWIL